MQFETSEKNLRISSWQGRSLQLCNLLKSATVSVPERNREDMSVVRIDDNKGCSRIAHGLSLVIFAPEWRCSCVTIVALCYTARQLHYEYLAMKGVPMISEDSWRGAACERPSPWLFRMLFGRGRLC